MRNDASISRPQDPRGDRRQQSWFQLYSQLLVGLQASLSSPEIGKLLMVYFVSFSGAEVNGNGQGAWIPDHGLASEEDVALPGVPGLPVLMLCLLVYIRRHLIVVVPFLEARGMTVRPPLSWPGTQHIVGPSKYSLKGYMNK